MSSGWLYDHARHARHARRVSAGSPAIGVSRAASCLTTMRVLRAHDPGGARTRALRIKSPLLYQLSYRVCVGDECRSADARHQTFQCTRRAGRRVSRSSPPCGWWESNPHRPPGPGEPGHGQAADARRPVSDERSARAGPACRLAHPRESNRTRDWLARDGSQKHREVVHLRAGRPADERREAGVIGKEFPEHDPAHHAGTTASSLGCVHRCAAYSRRQRTSPATHSAKKTTDSNALAYSPFHAKSPT